MQHFAVFATIGATGLLGTLGITIRNVSASSIDVMFFRSVVGAVLILLWILWKQDWRWLRFPKSPALWISGLSFTFTGLAYIIAIQYTALANAVLLLYLAPLLASVGAHFLFREHLRVSNLVLLAFALLGTACLLDFQFDISAQDSWGIICGLLAASCYAAYILSTRRIPAHIPVTIRLFYHLSISTAVAIPLLLFQEQSFPLADLPWLLACGIFQGFIPFLTIIFVLQHLSTLKYSSLAYMEPLTAAFCGWFFFAELLSGVQLVGSALILLSGGLQVFLTAKS